MTKAGIVLAMVSILVCASCTKNGVRLDQGLTVHQTVAVKDGGTPTELRLQVFEDTRITPALRAEMWGGPKDIGQFGSDPLLHLDAATRESLTKEPFRRGVLRLIDQRGNVIGERRLDCELAEIAQAPLHQQGQEIWAVGDDCSTGDGDFAGLITRFLSVASGKLAFQHFIDAATGDKTEVTLVSAARIRWHLVDKANATLIHEVSSHPDYESPAFKNLGADQAFPPDLPWIVELVTYQWTDQGMWRRSSVNWRRGKWSADDAWPDDASFPSSPPS